MTLRRAMVVLSLLAGIPSSGQAQTSTFMSRIDAVRVDALVSDQDRPVRGLTAADFEVLDNGVRQRIDLVSFESVPLNVVLVLDTSGSVAGDRLDYLAGAAGGLLDRLQRDDRSALITFSHIVARRSEGADSRPGIRAALTRSAGAGGTSLFDGIYSAMMIGESETGRPLVVVFSDGFDTSSWLSAEAVLETARRSDAVVYAVSAEASSKRNVLHDVTALTGGRLLLSESATALEKAFVEILDEFRQRYLISYSPTGVSADGWHRLDVRVRNRKAIVRARPGYLAGPSSPARR